MGSSIRLVCSSAGSCRRAARHPPGYPIFKFKSDYTFARHRVTVTESFTYRVLAPVLLARVDLVVTADAVSVLEGAGLDVAIDHEGELSIAEIVRILDWQAIARNSEVVVPLDPLEGLLVDGCLTGIDVRLTVLSAQIGVTARVMSKVRIVSLIILQKLIILLLVDVFVKVKLVLVVSGLHLNLKI